MGTDSLMIHPKVEKELWEVFHRILGESGMLVTPEECFAYMREMPEKYEQMSVFDL